MQGNAEYRGRGSRKRNIRAEGEKACTAGYQPATKSLCLGRMGVCNEAPEKVASELKTDTCTAGYARQRLTLCAWDAWAWVKGHQKR